MALYVQGFVRGIPHTNVSVAKQMLVGLVRESLTSTEPITMVVWDGDPMPCSPPEDDPAGFPNGASSFVQVVEHLLATFPHLKGVYFKKRTKLTNLLSDVNPAPKWEVFGDGPPEWRQWYGSWPRLTRENTKLVDADDASFSFDDRRYAGVGTGDGPFYQVTVDGLMWLKRVCGLDTITLFVLGGGGTIARADEALKDCQQDIPFIQRIHATVPRLDAFDKDGKLVHTNAEKRPCGIDDGDIKMGNRPCP